MPMLRRIPAEGRAAGDIYDAALSSAVAEMVDRESAKIGWSLEVDAQGPVPGRMPLIVIGTIGDILIDAGIVHEHVDALSEAAERGIPNAFGGCRVGEITGDKLVASAAGMAGHVMAGGFEQRIGRSANAAARSGDEDVHGLATRPDVKSRHSREAG